MRRPNTFVWGRFGDRSGMILGTEMQLLIAEQHDLALEGLRVILRRLGSDDAILAYNHFADALEAATNRDLGLVVLDLNLPGMNGVSGVEVFRSYFPDPPIVVLASVYQRRDVVAALRHGAAGFVPKSLRAEAMLNAFRLVLSGERFVPAAMLSDDQLDQPGLGAASGERSNGALHRLTGREEDVLGRLLEGLSNKEIGRALDIREVTVKLHLRSIYRKLGAKNRAQAVKITLQSGWEA